MKRSSSVTKTGGGSYGTRKKQQIEEYNNNPDSAWAEKTAVIGLTLFDMSQDPWTTLPEYDDYGNANVLRISRKALERELKCCMCMEVMSMTRIKINCMHRICENCSKDLIIKSESNTDQSNKIGCPFCRVPIHSRRDYRHDEIFDRMKDEIYPLDKRPPEKSDEELVLERAAMIRAAELMNEEREKNMRWAAFLRVLEGCLHGGIELTSLVAKIDSFDKPEVSIETRKKVRVKVVDWIISNKLLHTENENNRKILNDICAKLDGWLPVTTEVEIPEEICFVLTPYDTGTQPRLEKPFIRTRASATVGELKQYIVSKFPNHSSIDIALSTIVDDKVRRDSLECLFKFLYHERKLMI